MSIEGKWWLLVYDEPFSAKNWRRYELRASEVFDGQTGERLGSYTLSDKGADLLFDERNGERELIKLRMFSSIRYGEPVDGPFDSTADSYRALIASRHLEQNETQSVVDPNETNDQRVERERREEKEFAWFGPFAMFHRDCKEDRQIGEAMIFESERPERRISAKA
ncbi:hypothetical protein M9978_18920 [Sphingomonas sp. MG17]|uniref:Uncharacterized protein n=1 Tax=Sphingomonas tagetis TaxID=2949092 RepID=A0A9X2HTS5_9SPHN|nr:hypothetical protein [Sphingomonas tagetis]MCP3732500.1 hypothetical protein [Sphingomonas tagetis]